MASDVGPSPTLFEILLGSSLHVREVVFCECSVLELAQLSCASRAAREMSLTEMGRRKLDVNVRVEVALDDDDGEQWYNGNTLEKTVLIIKDRFGPTARIDGPDVYDQTTYMDGDRITIDHHKFATILHTLLAHCRIRSLEIQEKGDYRRFTEYHYIVLFLESGLLDPRSELFYIDLFRVPESEPCMRLLDSISARRITVTESEAEYGSVVSNIFSHRGISDAEHVEVRHDGWSLHHEEAAILALKAPNINVREWISIKEHDVRAIIGQWQAGHRNIVTFLAKTKTMPLLNDADNTDKGFADRIKNLVANSSEIPYPSDDVIPISVRL